MGDVKGKRRRKPLKRRYKALIALGISVSLALIAYLVLDLIATIALDRELAYLEEAGESINLADLAPPPVPDAENAALVYEKAFAARVDTESGTEDALIWALYDDEPWTLAKRVQLVTDLGLDTSAITQITEKGAWHAARKRLANNKASLELLRQAVAMDRMRFDIDYASDAASMLSMGSLNEHTVEVRASCRLLSLSARVKQHDGDWSGAYRDMIASLRLERAVRQPILVAHMVGVLVVHVTLKDAYSILKDDTNHPDDWRRFLAELEAADRRQSIVEAYKGERALMAAMMEDLRRQAPAVSRDDIDVRQPFWERPIPVRIWARLEEATYLRYMRAVIKAVGRLPHEALPELKAIEARVSRAGFGARMSKIGMPALTRVFEAHVKSEAQLTLAEVVLALKLHKRAKGAYPKHLSVLAPDILTTVPPDPFTGKPLIYRREGDGFVLYSVDANLADDGGVDAPQTAGLASRLDAVWRLEK